MVITRQSFFIAAHENEYTRAKVTHAGCAGCFNKSASGEDIIKAVRMILAQRSLR